MQFALDTRFPESSHKRKQGTVAMETTTCIAMVLASHHWWLSRYGCIFKVQGMVLGLRVWRTLRCESLRLFGCSPCCGIPLKSLVERMLRAKLLYPNHRRCCLKGAAKVTRCQNTSAPKHHCRACLLPLEPCAIVLYCLFGLRQELHSAMARRHSSRHPF